MFGTPPLTTYAHGAVHSRANSTPYGVRTRHDGGDEDRFRFTDKEWDDDTGYVYFGARYYDAGTGRWISADPLVLWGGGGLVDQNRATALVIMLVTQPVREAA